ncbi:MAG: TonB-dependent receptor, partial [Chitinophagaceae bacterium]
MNIKLLFIIASTFTSTFLIAQNNIKLKGLVNDTSFANKHLANMTVCVLNAKDSTIVQFTYSKADGSFNFSGLSGGNYILLISYPQYADYVEKFSLDTSNLMHDFGNIIMNSRARVLEEVVIKGKISAIQMKGDTTEYNAKAYVIQPNDKVEDLLRQLPGIQVDQNGKITAQGKTVTKVLLDGEEFFGDDPTIVTKNIRADMVDKVQLFDKKSDQATFTGIDDGFKTKTLNIKLKEDKNKGVFGKVNAGIGTNNYYDGQAIYNRFAANKKYAAFLTIANDGKTGLLNVDNNKIGYDNAGGGSTGLINTENGSDALDSYNGIYGGRGNPSIRNGGIHFDGKWNDINKQSINTNYQIGSIRVTGVNTINTQQSLPAGLINTSSNETFDNYAFRQKLDATYRLKIDSGSDLKMAGDLITKNFNLDNNHLTASENENGKLINRQTRSMTNKGNQAMFDGSAFYTKKFQKPRRTLSWELNNSYNNNETKGFLHSAIDFYNILGTKDSTENIDQYKTSRVTNFTLTSDVTYTEPISKSLSLRATYGLGVNKSIADRQSFNQSAAGHYDVLDQAYSNNYSFNQLTNRVGGLFIFTKNKTYFNVGTDVSKIKFVQHDVGNDNSYKRNFINWAPRMFYKYSFSLQRLLIFTYDGITTQPNIDQIQPVRSNMDPLNITVGNPNLKQSFTNNFRLNYQVNNPVNYHGMYLEARYSVISDNISSNITTNGSSGKTAIQYTNLSGKSPYYYSLFADISRRITPGDIRFDLSLRAMGSVSYSYINNVINSSGNYSYSGRVSLSKSRKNKFSIYISAAPNYTINEFSLQSQYNNNAFGFNSTGSGR